MSETANHTISHEDINELMKNLDSIYPESHSKCRKLTNNEYHITYENIKKRVQEMRINRLKD